MSLSYDVFTAAFLSKIMEYEFIKMDDEERDAVVDGCLKRAISEFKYICEYDLVSTADDITREFNVDIASTDLDEIVNIISEGMVMQWMKPYVYHQENLQNVLSTRDFSTYSPSELLARIGNAYAKVQKDYTQMIREYSYNHGDLPVLHL